MDFINNCDSILHNMRIYQHVFHYLRINKTDFFPIRGKVRKLNIKVVVIIYFSKVISEMQMNEHKLET